MSAFRGQFEHQMDDKGRVSLPSSFRRAEVATFVLVQLQKPYLTLYPESKWMEVEERLMEFGSSSPASMNAVRGILGSLAEVNADKQGRILIPAHLQEAAGLSGTVTLLGMSNRVELWDPATLRAQTEAAQEAQAELDALALKLAR